jgi:drug/metabolite transporter (DMT)-like permease
MVLAAALAFGSAFLHAGWNLFVKSSDDRLIANWGTLMGAALVAPIALAIGGVPDAVTFPYLATSVVLHLGYSLALVKAYQTSDFSVAYPIARGMAPLLVAVGGVLFLGDSLGLLGLLGAAVATVGLVSIGLSAGRSRNVRWAVVTGSFIVSYTLVDAAGVRSGGNSLGYVSVLLLASWVTFTAVVLRRRRPGELTAAFRADPLRMTAAGAMSVGAYVMVLAAVQMAPVGYVATLRETSVVLGVLGGWFLLKESFGPRRTRAALAIVAGVALLALGV